MDDLREVVVVPPVMLGMVVAVIERRLDGMEEAACCQTDRVAEQREVDVSVGVHLQTSHILAHKPCLCRDVVMERASETLYELRSDAQVVFRV